MLNLIGVILVWGGCALWGVHAGAALRGRVRKLERIGLGLEQIEREIEMNATELPELMERLSRQDMQRGTELFFACFSELEQGNSFAGAWGAALEKSVLSSRERQVLSGLPGVLGRYDVNGQVQALSHLRRNWDEHISLVQRRVHSLETVYGVLGVTMGGFLALMLV